MAKIITSYETISERICAIIDQFCNGNNTKFGELIGESEANVRNYKNGKTPPKYKALVAIVKNYGISPEWLLLGEGDVMRACASATQEKWRKNEDVDEEETVETLLGSLRRNLSRELQLLSGRKQEFLFSIVPF